MNSRDYLHSTFVVPLFGLNDSNPWFDCNTDSKDRLSSRLILPSLLVPRRWLIARVIWFCEWDSSGCFTGHDIDVIRVLVATVPADWIWLIVFLGSRNQCQVGKNVSFSAVPKEIILYRQVQKD